jgi:hypothetical protein
VAGGLSLTAPDRLDRTECRARDARHHTDHGDHESPSEGRLQAGTKLPPLEATGLKKELVTFRFEDSTLPTLLYVLRPGCIWCARNNDNLKAVIERAPGRYRVLIASLTEEGTAAYISEHGIHAAVVTNISEQTKRTYNLGGTPQTILISPQGVVIKNWMGAYTGGTAAEVQRTLSLELPGLVDVAAKSSSQ